MALNPKTYWANIYDKDANLTDDLYRKQFFSDYEKMFGKDAEVWARNDALERNLKNIGKNETFRQEPVLLVEPMLMNRLLKMLIEKHLKKNGKQLTLVENIMKLLSKKIIILGKPIIKINILLVPLQNQQQKLIHLLVLIELQHPDLVKILNVNSSLWDYFQILKRN